MLNEGDVYGYGQDYVVVRIDRFNNTLYGRHLKGSQSEYDDKLSRTEDNIKNGIWKHWPCGLIQTKSDGMACKRCQEFYPYAVANQPDGTLKCWSCRSSS